MTSNPPFHVEDQTDEDFFDKLVDDDFSAHGLGDADDFSGEGMRAGSGLFLDPNGAKAFDDLNFADVDPISAGGDDKNAIVDSEDFVSSADARSDVNQPIASNSDDTGDTDELDLGVSGSDSMENKATESTGLRVKVVDWSAFNIDVGQKAVDGFGSYSDFFSEFGDNCLQSSEKIDELQNDDKEECPNVGNEASNLLISSGHLEDRGPQGVNEAEKNISQYWENLYPGWKYDSNTGQWYQVDGNDKSSYEQGCDLTYSAGCSVNSGGYLSGSYVQQKVQSVSEVVTESCGPGNVMVPQGINEWPSHMVFDPQYPEWYYDTISQEWRLLETYTSSLRIQLTSQDSKQSYDPTVMCSQDISNGAYNSQGELPNYGVQSVGHHFGNDRSGGSNASMHHNYNNSSNYINDADTSGKHGNPSSDVKHQVDNVSYSALSAVRNSDRHISSSFIRPLSNESTNQMSSMPLNSIHGVQSFEMENQGNAIASGANGLRIFTPNGSVGQLHETDQKEIVHFPNKYYHNSRVPSDFSYNQVQNNSQFSSVSTVGRSSAGRPPHALITFGFGGKVIVMKNGAYSENSSFVSQDQTAGHSLSILNMMEFVTGNTIVSSDGNGCSNYFQVLCQQSFPGPLVGGNVGSKELNKWIDERIASCDVYGMDSRKSNAPWLLHSLLKIACQNYGKLRSPFGTDSSSMDNSAPESAVANLFTSSKRHSGTYGVSSCCLQNFPSEGHIQASATEVQNLLVSGRTKEALHCAQEGQLWGPALVLAAQLGDQFYAETVKQMALQQLMAGSPLRTLCLLIAGHPAEVFSANITTNTSFPVTDFRSNCMLDDWEENLAIITANKTKDDELVIIHLGDCLWKERSEVIAAHMCYLIAEANCESYSDGARMCLIGADHWKFPRTYSSPEAIQRTELYEYSKVLGNSQFNLLPFQPYKLVYAHMLAEVGRVSDALKYCQAATKSLKTSRGPEVDSLKQLVLSFEERIKTHQQGGFTANLAPAKLVGKLLNLFDSTAHRVVGGLPPPAPSTSQTNAQNNGHFNQMGPRVSASQSTMAMSSLIPSASTDQWSANGNRKSMHNRSVSEPDFGRTPRQKDGDASRSHGKTPGAVSRFGRFGFGSQIFQKTMGLVLKRPDRQAKLGESNKFYYDEKLKRWMEEGAELPSDEIALPPPPTASTFQNGVSSTAKEASPANRSSEFKSPNPAELSSGIPPIHPSGNQFSTRGRIGVRSRYVDTFNQGGGSTSSSNLFHSPSATSIKPTAAMNPKFFVPTPLTATAAHHHMVQPSSELQQVDNTSGGGGLREHSPAGMQRTPSMDNMANPGATSNGSVASHSRRTVSWGGSFTGVLSPPKSTQTKLLGEALGMPPSTFMAPQPTNGFTSGDDMHEVEL